MRLRQLQLARYGKFSDHVLDFGRAVDGQADFHIIYGLNEAGKSTAMSAWLDFLFGIHSRTTYNFLHDNPALKIGATLDIEGTSYSFSRVKKNKNSLLDDTDKPISDTLLLQQLSGLGRDAYSNMFSLDDETLEKGGESILASEGNLGQLLYAATSGVAKISEVLLELRAESDQFHKKGGRTQAVQALKKELKDIVDQRKELDTLAAEYKNLIATRDDAVAIHEQKLVERERLSKEMDTLKNDLNAIVRVRRIGLLNKELLPLNHLVDAPEQWARSIDDVSKRKYALEIDLKRAGEKLEALKQQLAADDGDLPALQSIENWEDVERSREDVIAASRQLPELQAEYEVATTEVASCVKRLGRHNDEPGSLLLDTVVVATAKKLIKEFPELNSAYTASTKELDAVKSQLDIMRSRMTVTDNQPDSAKVVASIDNSMQELQLAIAALEQSDLFVTYKSTNQSLQIKFEEIDSMLLSLLPWKGSVADLQTLPVPSSDDLRNWSSQREELRAEVRNSDQEIAAARKNVDDLRIDTEAVSKTIGIVDDGEANNQRLLRDQAWSVHRRELSSESAEIFENLMRKDDAMQIARIQHMADVARLNQLKQSLHVAEQQLPRLKENSANLAERQQVLESTISNTVTKLSPMLTELVELEKLDAWISCRANILERQQEVIALQRTLQSIDTETESASISVNRALESAGFEPVESTQFSGDSWVKGRVLQEALNRARLAVKSHAELAGERKQLLETEAQMNFRESELARSKNTLQQWIEQWNQLLAPCWMAESVEFKLEPPHAGPDDSATISPIISPEVVEGLLGDLESLQVALDRHRKLENKIETRSAVLKTFERKLNELTDRLEMTLQSEDPEQRYRIVKERIDESLQQQRERESLVEQQKSLQLELDDLETESKEVFGTGQQMMEHFGVESLTDVSLKLQDLATKRSLLEQISQEQEALLQTLDVKVLDNLEAVYQDFDAESAKTRLDAVTREATELDLELKEVFSAMQEAKKAVEAVGGDDRVALLEEQHSVLMMSLNDQATRYVQQRLGVLAADRALSLYRDRHRGSMLTRASTAFMTMSRGEYTKLDTQSTADANTLIAITKSGNSKLSSALSKGARFQLYLSLRVAGYLEYIGNRPALPFFADDILETFDDLRASEAISVFNDMAKHGQVIYLTHHRHLCDLAKTLTPAVTIHEL